MRTRQLYMVFPMMRADFLERVRSTSFLVMLLFSVFLTYFFLPAPDAVLYANLAMGAARPAYTSAAIGSLTTLLMGEFFTLFAFYLVKGSIERDRMTGVGQVLATTPVSRSAYTVGKWLSNTAVITAMVGAILLSAIFLQLIRGEDLHFDLWAMSAPFLIILLPALTLVAALAVLFESVNWLRGGFGNVLYFGVFLLLLGLPVDVEGIQILYPSLYQACAAQFSGCNPVRQIDISGALAGLPTFNYSGVTWTMDIIAGRLLYVAAGALLAGLAALPFHRFDPARTGSSRPRNLAHWLRGALLRFVTEDNQAGAQGQPAFCTTAEKAAGEKTEPVDFQSGLALLSTPLQREHSRRGIFLQALAAEFRLAFNGVRWWWFVGAVGLSAAGLLVKAEYVLLVILPLVWIWPLTLWSGMGAREARHAVDQLIFTTPHPVSRQLLAAWLVGALVAVGMASSVIFRLIFLGQWQVLPAVLVGSLFIPTLALAAGCWTGGSKLFEAGYLFVWYMAAVHGVPLLDFMGRIPAMRAQGLPWVYAGLTVILAFAAVMGRLRIFSR